MKMTRRGFTAAVAASGVLDWARLNGAVTASRPFGAGEEVLSPRIARLQSRSLAADVYPAAVKVAYDPADAALPDPVRIGKRLGEYISAQPVTIYKDEELVGWLAFDGSVEGDFYRRTGHKKFFGHCFRKYYVKPVRRLAIFEWQHACADFRKIVDKGLCGIRAEIAASRVKHAGDKARLDYLRGLDLALDGIEARQRKAAAECRALAAKETDAARKATLLEMAARCDRVPLHPARTFAEGIQSVFFCYDFLADAIGRIDQYLKPLYFADLEAGRITKEKAREYLQEFFICINSHTSIKSGNYDKGGECHMTVGGLDTDGSDGWSDFSRLVVEACMACDLKRPQMSFRWNGHTKREVLAYILDCERRDPNKRIALDGDVPRVRALVERCGFTPEVARDYCITGCNEPTFMGGVSYGGFHMNALRCMERVCLSRRADALACRTWEDFAALFEQELHHDLTEADAISKEFNALRAGDCNVLSALFLEGCIEHARGPTHGGARRSCPCIDLLGTPNLIDSLSIVRQFVFEEKRCTMKELLDALAADWKGHEKLHGEIRAHGRFYGANDPFTNAMARYVHGAVARFAEGRRDYFGLPLMFGNHTGYNDNSTKFGRLTGATPDGRRAGEFLSFGGGPASGRGPAAATSVLLAAAQMDPTDVMCGTSILNLSLSECTVTDESDFRKLVILVETYFRNGGLHLQLNHVSRETLVDAQKNPHRYPDLRVRVSGFSGYFVRFKKTIQDEIIARTVTSVR